MNTTLHPQTDSLSARVAITCVIEPGDTAAGALITALGPIDAWKAMTGPDTLNALQAAGIDKRHAQEATTRWAPRIRDARVDETLAAINAAGVTVIDPDTIPALADLGDARPAAIYVRGNAALLPAQPAVSVIGARASSAYGEHVTTEIISDLASHGVTIISGAAYGIEGTAHRAALAAGLPTIAVLAGGVERSYPVGHSNLLDRIAEQGAVVSELPSAASPTRWRFLARGRVIAALSPATVVIEAGFRSGTLSTAGHALALGRRLGAVSGPVTSATSAGCHRLIREHSATLITGAADVLALLR